MLKHKTKYWREDETVKEALKAMVEITNCKYAEKPYDAARRRFIRIVKEETRGKFNPETARTMAVAITGNITGESRGQILSKRQMKILYDIE